MRTFIKAFLPAILTSSFALSAPPRFEPHDIGSLVGLSTRAMALNDQGDVVGSSAMGPGGDHSEPPANAFLYANGILTDLFGGETGAVSVATAINEARQVVGYRRWEVNGPSQPFYYPGPTGVVYLNPFNIEFSLAATGAAYGINEPGDMVGLAFKDGAGNRAFLTASPDGLGVDLTPGLASPYYASGASAVNDFGQIVGVLLKLGGPPTNDTTDGFLLDGSGFTNLDDVLTQDPAFAGASFEPKAINGAGVIAGYLYGADRPVHASVYENGSFVDLGAPTGESSWGYGIDSGARVVGDATTGGGSSMRAFLWENGGMHDLNELVADYYGIVLTNARAVNELGQIVTWGYRLSDPEPSRIVRSYLLTPVSTSDAIEDLIEFIEGLGLHHGIENSLIVKLEHAISALEAGDIEGACSRLAAFINEVQAQTGKKIPAADAALLIAEATSLRQALGCP